MGFFRATERATVKDELGKPINIRLHASHQARLEAESVALGYASFRTYLREKLESQVDAGAQVEALRQESDAAFIEIIERLEALNLNGNDQGSEPGRIAIETLYLLRTAVGPESLNKAHKELKRIGVEPYVFK